MGNSNGNSYSEEFKQVAVKLVLEKKQSIAEVYENSGVSQNALARWLMAEEDSQDDDKIRMHQMEVEIKQFRRKKENLGMQWKALCGEDVTIASLFMLQYEWHSPGMGWINFFKQLHKILNCKLRNVFIEPEYNKQKCG